MTDLEIDKALALAIGWQPEQMTAYTHSGNLYIKNFGQEKVSRIFSHLDWNVVGPIAEWFGTYPRLRLGRWEVWITSTISVRHEDPRKAIALAVIEWRKM